MTALLPVAVTATTESIRGVLRTRANVAYTAAARAVSLRPYVLPVLPPADADAVLEGMAGLLLTGGEDVDPGRYGVAAHPALGEVHVARDAFEVALVVAARARRLPTFAICRGLQILNVALGGSLVQDLPSQRPGTLAHDGGWRRDARVHEVEIRAGSRLAEAVGDAPFAVNSMHHQAIDRVADPLRVVARATDAVIEAVESGESGWWMLGVQWHPEELIDAAEARDRALFAAFADAVAAAVSSPGASGPRS